MPVSFMHAVSSPLPPLGFVPTVVRRRGAGFTLIEVMIAVAIVALLASVAMPAYTAWRNRALSRQTGQELAVMSAIIDQYGADNGGVYPADLSVVGLSAKTDPWGRTYTYVRISDNGSSALRRQDKSTNPINLDYDLYSVGPDGLTAKQLDNASSKDDIVRGRNGRFFGLASDF